MGQLSHVALLAVIVMYKPLLHLQSPTASLPGDDTEAAGQMLHVPAVVAAVAVEKVPPAQSLHATRPDASLNLPGTQVSHLCFSLADQRAVNPPPVALWSDEKVTCIYPVDDVYCVLELTELPLSRASCVFELHDDDVHRYIVTWSQHDSVLK